jgi:hypothetical protein
MCPSALLCRCGPLPLRCKGHENVDVGLADGCCTWAVLSWTVLSACQDPLLEGAYSVIRRNIPRSRSLRIAHVPCGLTRHVEKCLGRSRTPRRVPSCFPRPSVCMVVFPAKWQTGSRATWFLLGVSCMTCVLSCVLSCDRLSGILCASWPVCVTSTSRFPSL